MRRLLLIGCTALALAACATTPLSGLSGGPVVVADQTKLDEQLGLTITLAYTASAKAAKLAIEAADATGHPFSHATLQTIENLRAKAYAGVVATRQAYEAGNSAGYLDAAKKAKAAVADLLAAVKG